MPRESEQSNNPAAGLSRLQQRLDKNYGSPEVIEDTVDCHVSVEAHGGEQAESAVSINQSIRFYVYCTFHTNTL